MGRLRSRPKMRWRSATKRGKATGSRCRARYFFRSPPALKARPAPVTRRVRISRSFGDVVDGGVEGDQQLAVDGVQLGRPVEPEDRCPRPRSPGRGAPRAPTGRARPTRRPLPMSRLGAERLDDLVLLDLPRSGGGQAVEHLEALGQLVGRQAARPQPLRRSSPGRGSPPAGGPHKRTCARRDGRRATRPRRPAPLRRTRRADPRSPGGRC